MSDRKRSFIVKPHIETFQGRAARTGNNLDSYAKGEGEQWKFTALHYRFTPPSGKADTVRYQLTTGGCAQLFS